MGPRWESRQQTHKSPRRTQARTEARRLVPQPGSAPPSTNQRAEIPQTNIPLAHHLPLAPTLPWFLMLLEATLCQLGFANYFAIYYCLKVITSPVLIPVSLTFFLWCEHVWRPEAMAWASFATSPEGAWFEGQSSSPPPLPSSPLFFFLLLLLILLLFLILPSCLSPSSDLSVQPQPSPSWQSLISAPQHLTHKLLLDR